MVAQLNPVSPVSGGTLGARAAAANVTAQADQIINCDSTIGSFTVTLPAPGSFDDDTIVMVKDSAGLAATNPITVAGGGGQTIDGAASVQLAINNGLLCIGRDGERGCWTLLVAPLQLQGAVEPLYRVRDLGASPGGVTPTPAGGTTGITRKVIANGATTTLTAPEAATGFLEVTGAGAGPRTVRYAAAAPTDANAYRRNVLNSTAGDLVVDTGSGTTVTIGAGLSQDIGFDANGARNLITGI